MAPGDVARRISTLLPQCHGPDAVSVSVVAGEGEIPGLTDELKPKMRGPKRASKIRKLYNLSKDDDVRQAVKLHSRKIEKDGKSIIKVPKIQRLVTPAALQRKRRRAAQKKQRIASVRPRNCERSRRTSSRLD